MNLKKTVACILLIAMFMSLAVGCASPTTTPKATSPETTSSSPKTTAGTSATSATTSSTTTTAGPKEFTYVEGGPVTDKKDIEITVLTHSGASSSLTAASRDLPIYKAYEERLNVKFNWQVLDFSTYNETYSVRMMSSDLPDIAVSRDRNQTIKLVKDGFFYAYDDLNFEKNAPYANKLFKDPEYEKLPGLLRQIHSDGKLYSFGNTIVPRFLFFNVMYNVFWLKKLDIPEPTTIDEFYNMLVAFRDKDPNGNNKQDEVPLANIMSGVDYAIGPAFSLNFNNPWSVDDKGVLTYDRVTENYRDYLRYLNKLYSANLIDREKRNLNAYYELIGQDRLGVIGYYATFSADFSNYSPHAAPAGTPNDKQWPVFLELIPVKNVYTGKPTKYPRYQSPTGIDQEGMLILKKAKEPEICLRVADWFWASEEYTVLRNYGIKDLTYKVASDGSYQYLDPPKGFGSIDEYIRSLGGGQPPFANRQILEIMRAKQIPWVVKRHDEIAPYYVEGMPPFMLNAEQELQKAKVLPDINTAYTEWRADFMTGRKSLDTDWNEYLKTMKAVGLDKFTSIHQEYYNKIRK